MRKILGVLSILCLTLFVSEVSAKEIYYTNDNGVSFTQEEYDFLTFMYHDGIQDLLTKENYEEFIDSGIMYGETQKDSVGNTDIMPYGTYWETSAKRLEIVSSCVSSYCLVAVTLTWKGTPSVKSYDVMGAYLDNTSLLNTISTVVQSTADIYSVTESKYFVNGTNGFGVSIDMSKAGSSIIISQTYRIEPQGHVYASYQHATKSITLANSKTYYFSKAGYGGVFQFLDVGIDTYDAMHGVDLAF